MVHTVMRAAQGAALCRGDFAHVGAIVFAENATASLDLNGSPAGLVTAGFGFAFVMPADGFFLGFEPISKLPRGQHPG
jgi:hypothetical protein